MVSGLMHQSLARFHGDKKYEYACRRSDVRWFEESFDRRALDEAINETIGRAFTVLTEILQYFIEST